MSRGVDWVIFIVEIVAVVAFIALGTNFVLGGGGAGGFVLDRSTSRVRWTRTSWRRASPSRRFRSWASTACPRWPRKRTSLRRTSARASSSHCPSSSSCSWRRLHRRHRAARLGGHRSRHGLLRFRLPSGRAGVLQDHVAGQHRRGGHRQHHQRADGILAPAVQHGPRRRDPARVGKVHPKFQTPWFASIFLGAITLCLALPLQDYMGTLAGFVNFGALSSFILLNFAVFWFFFVKEKKRASFKDILMYLICPFIGIAFWATCSPASSGPRMPWASPGWSSADHRRGEIQGLQGSARGVQEPGSVRTHSLIEGTAAAYLPRPFAFSFPATHHRPKTRLSFDFRVWHDGAQAE